MMEINILSHCKEFIPNPCPDSCMRGSNLQGPPIQPILLLLLLSLLLLTLMLRLLLPTLLLITLLLQQLTAYTPAAAAVWGRMSEGHCTCEGHIHPDLWQHIANTQKS